MGTKSEHAGHDHFDWQGDCDDCRRELTERAAGVCASGGRVYPAGGGGAVPNDPTLIAVQKVLDAVPAMVEAILTVDGAPSRQALAERIAETVRRRGTDATFLLAVQAAGDDDGALAAALNRAAFDGRAAARA